MPAQQQALMLAAIYGKPLFYHLRCMVLTRLLFSTVLLFCFSASLHSQCILGDSIWGKPLLFTEDSVGSFANFLVTDSVLSNIRDSKADIEIRVHVKPVVYDRGNVYIVSCTNNNLTAERLLYKFEDPNLKPLPGFSSGRTGPRYRINYFVRRQTPTAEWNKAFRELIACGIFSIRDEGGLLDSLQKAGVQVVDPCEMVTDCGSKSLIDFEVKYKSQVRSFRLLAIDFFKVNPRLRVFEPKNKIIDGVLKFFGKFTAT
jgi:hypothetical protein